jgi:hypothetical protein
MIQVTMQFEKVLFWNNLSHPKKSQLEHGFEGFGYHINPRLDSNSWFEPSPEPIAIPSFAFACALFEKTSSIHCLALAVIQSRLAKTTHTCGDHCIEFQTFCLH